MISAPGAAAALGLEALASHWWILLIRGIAAIAFAVLAFAFPGATIVVLILIFGAYALVDGILLLAAAVRFSHEGRRWIAFLLEGIVGVLIGLVTFFWPNLTAFALSLLIAAWALLTGIFEISAAVRMRQNIPGEILLIVVGALSIALGIFMAIFPGAALLAWVWTLAVYAIIAGVALIALSFRLRTLQAGAARS